MSLQECLLALEMDTVEVVAGLVTEFDRSYSEMAEANKLQYNAYFTQVGGSEFAPSCCGSCPPPLNPTECRCMHTAQKLVAYSTPQA